MTEQAEATETSEPTNEAPAEEEKSALKQVVADGTAPEEAETKEEPKSEPEKPKEKDTALFKAALKFRDEATEKLQKATIAEERLLAEKREVETLRGEVAKQKADIDAIKADPFKFFELFNVDPNDFARHLMKYNEVPPEQRARDKELEDIKRWKAEREEREKQEAAARVAQETAQLEEKVKANFVTFLDQHFDDYPDVAADDPVRTSAEFLRLATLHWQNTGNWPPLADVAAHMQREESERRATREERSKQRGTAKSSEPTTPRENGQAATSPGPRSPTTLTNKQASARAAPPREFKSEAELNEWAAEELRRALEGSAA